ncbi:hypothetical protein BDV95DRAFT_596356 [Massariosphaeria phaeospora]|uniref:Uncharacterized protein n=1 Tax=Massariosphaeria phaeospora TaxID=100035 RepID=A0A7C8M5V2_9PLEO|nr:hypothetical protein BDV95DRAFT_596356 [Massariosphaeria phaeospora]
MAQRAATTAGPGRATADVQVQGSGASRGAAARLDAALRRLCGEARPVLVLRARRCAAAALRFANDAAGGSGVDDSTTSSSSPTTPPNRGATAALPPRARRCPASPPNRQPASPPSHDSVPAREAGENWRGRFCVLFWRCPTRYSRYRTCQLAALGARRPLNPV